MKSGRLNTLTRALADVCREDVLTAKYLIAPSLRVGFQWLDTVTRSGQPVLNVHVKTLRHMALDMASPEMNKKGLSFLRGVREEVILNQIFVRLKEDGNGYLSGLDASRGLIQALLRTISDLRLAGVTSNRLRGEAFEVVSKGKEIKRLLSEYEKMLAAEKFADYADVLQMGTRRIKAGSGIPVDGVILLPGNMEDKLSGLEKIFWNTVPAANRRILPVDCSGSLVPGEDTEVMMFRAVGEVNEVREVLRRCVKNNIPFDEVEILHTDGAVYVPIIYELTCRVAPEDGGSIPVTFVEGIPARFSRPGRALIAWLSWIRSDFPQSTLMRMIQDGLLRIPGTAEKKFGFTRLAEVFRSVSIGAGRSRYLRCIEEDISGLNKQIRQERRRDLTERIEGLGIIRDLVRDIIDGIPSNRSGQKAVLEAAAEFTNTQVRCVNQLDEYSREVILKEIRKLIDCFDGKEEVEGLNIWEWMEDLPADASVGGLGPRPGDLYVSNIYAGGYSGRKHTFIVGLDDSRFPGAGLQDPLLLDGERKRVSGNLPTSAGRMGDRIADFSSLMARLRGSVTLSYCCRSLTDDREMFPGPVLLDIFRVLSSNQTGDQDDMLRWLPDPVSFAPADADCCIDSTEWWLWRICGGEAVKDPKKLVARHFPHLGRGMTARVERESDRFTAYDGCVPEAGEDFDPAGPKGPVLSASRLELLGRCPMEYFFKYVLGIEPPEEDEIDPSVWLDALDRGTLLHAVFRQFMARLLKEKRVPEFPRDENILSKIMDRHIKEARAQTPPPNDTVFEHDCRELRQTARIFLQEEAEFCTGSRPLYLEVALGLRPEGDGTNLDEGSPVLIALADGREIRARGRVDRVDEISKGNRYTVWDYKTGSSYGFDERDPFRGGRKIQSILYLAMIEKRLREKVSPDAVVERFGYFFPNVREHGRRISWSARDLAGGIEIVTRLCDMIAGGCFPFTDDPDDVRYSDYADAFGDRERAAEGTRAKMENTGNTALDSFRCLRGYDGEEE